VLTGKQFKLTRPIVGIHLVDGTTSVATIPVDAVIKVLSGPNGNGKIHEKGIVYVLWEDRTIALFTVDLELRGTEIQDQSTTA